MSEPEVPVSESELLPVDEETLVHARQLAEHYIAILLVRKELLVAGDPVNTERAYRLRAPLGFFHTELQSIGQLGLVNEMLGSSEDNVQGHKSLPI